MMMSLLLWIIFLFPTIFLLFQPPSALRADRLNYAKLYISQLKSGDFEEAQKANKADPSWLRLLESSQPYYFKGALRSSIIIIQTCSPFISSFPDGISHHNGLARNFAVVVEVFLEWIRRHPEFGREGVRAFKCTAVREWSTLFRVTRQVEN